MKNELYDLETDSVNPDKANLKFYGGLNPETGELVMMPYTKNVEIADRIKQAKILTGFNIKEYDNKILERFGISCKYKSIIDLYQCLAPNNFASKSNKNRLHDINPGLKLKNYKLDTIVKALGLDDEGSKGKIDYDIFKKEGWTEEEIQIIEKYHEQDLRITLKLFNWYRNIFKPLEKYLDPKVVVRYKHLTCKSGGVAYKFQSYQSGFDEEYRDWEEAAEIKKNAEKIEGGHHIRPKHEKVKGTIICRDYVSHYPTIIVGFQLHNNNKVNNAIELNLNLRMKAKSSGDKATALALKVPLNATFGIMGDPRFTNMYDPHAASECTRIGRDLLKRYAKTLEIAGFIPLYGFTDSVYCGVPATLTPEDLDIITEVFVELTRDEFVKPVESYGLGVDGVYKFMWFIEKKDNNYLKITSDDKIEIKGGLFDKNTPVCVLKTFNEFISPKILRDLDVDFNEEELKNYIIKVLKDNPELASQEYTVKKLEDYQTETSIQYKISKLYGPGTHMMIPNTKEIGVGASSTYCTLEDFKKNNLTADDIYMDRIMRYMKPFYSTKEEVYDLNAEAKQ